MNPKFGPTDYKSFEDKVKNSKGEFSYASSGTGGIQHMLMELYKNLTGTAEQARRSATRSLARCP